MPNKHRPVVPSSRSPVPCHFDKIRSEFETLLADGLGFEDTPPQLKKAVAHAVLTPGKRLRPFLCISAAQAVAGRLVRHALPYAVAIEYLHAYTLIHDDLPAMDNDRTRRGKPTVWVKFGEANAILAGDYLQGLAFERALWNNPHPSATLACGDLAEAATRVVSGQMLDLKHAGTKNRNIINSIHRLKTAALFEAAAKMGARAADATREEIAALEIYATHFGLAFQIADDLSDAENSEKKELSVCNAMTVARARKELDNHVATALEALKTPGCFQNGNVTPLAGLAEKLMGKGEIKERGFSNGCV